MTRMKRSYLLLPKAIVLTVLSMLVTGQGLAQEPSLAFPWTESQLEPGDMAHYFQALRPRSDFRYTYKTMNVLGTEIAYVDEGQGNPIVFLHGAPESAYVWRNIMPYLEPYGRIIAPELPGHGRSGKPDIESVLRHG